MKIRKRQVKCRHCDKAIKARTNKDLADAGWLTCEPGDIPIDDETVAWCPEFYQNAIKEYSEEPMRYKVIWDEKVTRIRRQSSDLIGLEEAKKLVEYLKHSPHVPLEQRRLSVFIVDENGKEVKNADSNL